MIDNRKYKGTTKQHYDANQQIEKEISDVELFKKIHLPRDFNTFDNLFNDFYTSQSFHFTLWRYNHTVL